MPLTESDIEEGGYYLTPGNQLRRVDAITPDGQGRRRVRFVAKSDNIPDEAFGPGSTITNASQPFVGTSPATLIGVSAMTTSRSGALAASCLGASSTIGSASAIQALMLINAAISGAAAGAAAFC